MLHRQGVRLDGQLGLRSTVSTGRGMIEATHLKVRGRYIRFQAADDPRSDTAEGRYNIRTENANSVLIQIRARHGKAERQLPIPAKPKMIL